MPLTVLTAPAVEPLSLSEVKLHCRVDASDEDTLLTALIVAAREYAEQLTGRAFITRTYELLEPATGEAFELRFPPFGSLLTVQTIDILGNIQTATATIGSGTNGTVTLSVDGEAGNDYTVTVEAGDGNNLPLSVAESGGDIVVTLGTGAAGALDAAKNTATLVAAACDAITNVTATASGTGATALTTEEGPTSFTGGAGTLTTVSTDDYTLDRLPMIPTLEVSDTSGEAEAVRVTYTAGYGATAASVPQAIRQAMILMVGHWYAQRETASPVELREVPHAAEALLNCYRVEFYGMGVGR